MNPRATIEVEALSRKPRVAVDVDGVLMNTIEAGLRVAFKLTGKQHHHDDVVTWAMEDSFSLSEALRERFYEHWRRQGFVLGMEPYPRSYDGIATLQNVAELYIATAHFPEAPFWVAEREQSLERHFNIDPQVIVHTHAKHLLHVDFLIEDKTSTLIKWKAQHPDGCAIRIRRNYNKHEAFDGVECVDMVEAAQMIQMLWEDIADVEYTR